MYLKYLIDRGDISTSSCPSLFVLPSGASMAGISFTNTSPVFFTSKVNSTASLDHALLLSTVALIIANARIGLGAGEGIGVGEGSGFLCVPCASMVP